MTETTAPDATEEAASRSAPRSSGRINRWLTLGANLGVLLGLIILIIEVRQNASTSRLAVEVSRAEANVTIELGLAHPDVANAWMTSIYAPETLTDAQLRMAETQLVMIMQQWDILFSLQSEGLVSRERVEMSIRNQAPFYFGSRFAKHWWYGEAVGWQNTPMFKVAGPILDEVDPNFLVNRFAEIRAPFSRDSNPGISTATKFTLLDLPREAVAPGIVRQYVTGVESTFSRWEVAAGAVVPMHSHHNEQVTLLLSGAADVVSGDQSISLAAGDMLVLPPNEPHAYTFTEDSIVIEFFAPRRQDWIDPAGARPNWAPEP